MLNKLPKTDENTIKGIYKLARTHAFRHSTGTYLDTDDLTQEGMLAYLEGRTIQHGILGAYRSAAPIRWRRGCVKLRVTQEELDENTLACEQDYEMSTLLAQIWDTIFNLFDARTADMLYRRFKLGHEFHQIGDHYAVTASAVHQTITKAVLKLRRRFK